MVLRCDFVPEIKSAIAKKLMLLGNTENVIIQTLQLTEHHKSNNSMYKQEYIILYYIIIIRFLFCSVLWTCKLSEHLSVATYPDNWPSTVYHFICPPVYTHQHLMHSYLTAAIRVIYQPYMSWFCCWWWGVNHISIIYLKNKKVNNKVLEGPEFL